MTSTSDVAGLPPLLSSSPLSAPALDAALEAQRSSARLVVSVSSVSHRKKARSGCCEGRASRLDGRERGHDSLSLIEIHAVENQNGEKETKT